MPGASNFRLECELAELSEQLHNEQVEQFAHVLRQGAMRKQRHEVKTISRLDEVGKPQFRELWRVGRRAVFILGNSVRSDGTIWTADNQRWVLRDASGAWIDVNQYRHDIFEHNGLRTAY